MSIIVESPQSGPAITAPVETEAVIAQAEAAVEIAQVEAEARVAVAEVEAETVQAGIEAAAEVASAVTREELDECRRSIETQGQTLERISAQVQLISETLVEEETEERPNPNGDPASERTENPGHTEQVQEAESPPEPVKKKPAIRWT